MKKITNLLFSELNNSYHQYFFESTNRKKLLKLVLYCVFGFGIWLAGYKWRDAKIIIQTIQIQELSDKKDELNNNISTLESQLEEYNFMISDGDYFRYLAYKHGDILVPKDVDPADLKLMTEMSKEYNIPFKYFYRLVWKESGYNPTLSSTAGAGGYMQVMPGPFVTFSKMYRDDSTATRNLDELTPNQQNIVIGAYILDYHYKHYKNWKLALAAYNAGPGNVTDHVPNIPETQYYVKFILDGDSGE